MFARFSVWENVYQNCIIWTFERRKSGHLSKIKNNPFDLDYLDFFSSFQKLFLMLWHGISRFLVHFGHDNDRFSEQRQLYMHYLSSCGPGISV